MTNYGQLHHADTNITIVDPRFGVGPEPAQPNGWGGNGQAPIRYMYSTSQHYRTPGITGGYPATCQDVYDLYDAIGGVTSSVLGQDGAGNDVREYQIAQPDVPNGFDLTKLKVGITSGIHGNETTPVTGLHAFIKDLTENPNGNELFRKILALCDLRIIPVGTPTGWDNRSRLNGNGVNVNRNFTTNWTDDGPESGTEPASEPETQILETWMADSGLDVYVDIHNTIGIDNPWFVANHNRPEGQSLIKDYYQVESINHRWWLERDDIAYNSPAPLGRTDVYNHNLPTAYTHADAIGIPHVALIEVAARYLPDTASAGIASNTFSAETIGNILLTSLDRILRTHQA